jgi:hypothetical protein
MPEPKPLSHEVAPIPPLWPDTLPNPQADSIVITGPGRVERSNVLTGPTRLRVKARTASMSYGFTVWLTAAQMQAFEQWYVMVVRDYDGEFYARWIGGSRVVAFIEPYTYRPLGAGYELGGRVIRTRIDERLCDAYVSEIFGAVYIDDGISPDVYEAQLGASDVYVSEWDLGLIVRHEC